MSHTQWRIPSRWSKSARTVTLQKRSYKQAAIHVAALKALILRQQKVLK